MIDITKIIFSAIENKYGNYREEVVRSIVLSTINDLHNKKNIDDIITTGSPTIDFKSDVINQTRCYFIIENYLRHRNPEDNFIEIIYATVFGIKQADIKLRDEQYVEDYGGFVSEIVDNIEANLAKLNHELKGVTNLTHSPIEEKTAFLSRIFSEIIRTHPFQDGNGRTARMVVQLCLRYWGYKYIVIPKVRNNIIWKKALQNGIEGDYKEMQSFFEKEIIIGCPVD